MLSYISIHHCRIIAVLTIDWIKNASGGSALITSAVMTLTCYSCRHGLTWKDIHL